MADPQDSEARHPPDHYMEDPIIGPPDLAPSPDLVSSPEWWLKFPEFLYCNLHSGFDDLCRGPNELRCIDRGSWKFKAGVWGSIQLEHSNFVRSPFMVMHARLEDAEERNRWLHREPLPHTYYMARFNLWLSAQQHTLLPEDVIDFSTASIQEYYYHPSASFRFCHFGELWKALEIARHTSNIYICWKGQPMLYHNMQLLNETNGVLAPLSDFVVPNHSEDDTDAAFVLAKDSKLAFETCILKPMAMKLALEDKVSHGSQPSKSPPKSVKAPPIWYTAPSIPWKAPPDSMHDFRP